MANGFASGLRVVLAATAVQIAGAASGLAAVPESGRLDFAVMRNGDQIGLHEMKFHKTGNDMQVDINTKVAVKIAFLTVYHFDHEGHEVWRGGNLLHLWSQTDDDGTTHVLDAAATAGGLEVRADGKPTVARDPMVPASLWNETILKGGGILNTLDGSPMSVAVADLGTETIDAGGKRIPARHYAVSGDLQRDLWYDQRNVLVRVHFKGKDGSDIEYVLR